MRLVNVYSQSEGNNKYTYRFEFKDVTHYIYPSFMLHYASHKIVDSMLSQLHEYTSLHKVKPYENIRG